MLRKRMRVWSPRSPVLGGEASGVRWTSDPGKSPLTPALSPEYRGEGEGSVPRFFF
jgi:hypothetical protein